MGRVAIAIKASPRLDALPPTQDASSDSSACPLE